MQTYSQLRGLLRKNGDEIALIRKSMSVDSDRLIKLRREIALIEQRMEQDKDAIAQLIGQRDRLRDLLDSAYPITEIGHGAGVTDEKEKEI